MSDQRGHLLQWLSEARAYTADLELQVDRLARALGGIRSCAPLCPVCESNLAIARKALEGIPERSPPPVDPHTGLLVEVEGAPV